MDVITGRNKNTKEEVDIKKNKWVFDIMLYLNLPIVFSLLYIGFSRINSGNYEKYEFVGLILSGGILLATNAINVAHELGHRTKYYERF